jgi:hypothetical protein
LNRTYQVLAATGRDKVTPFQSFLMNRAYSEAMERSVAQTEEEGAEEKGEAKEEDKAGEGKKRKKWRSWIDFGKPFSTELEFFTEAIRIAR